jgi:DNA-binding NarL/FixJ family response regulator
MHAGRKTLTSREVEVLQLVARGLSNREIGSELVIAEGTVKSHMHRILRKLRVANRTAAAVAAFHQGSLPRKLEA